MTAPDLASAQRIIASQVRPLETETVPLPQAAGRIPAAAVRARLPLPPFSRATRDGFAVASADLPGKGGPAIILKIAGEVAAGCTELPILERGRAIRIMTGAAIPPGATQVVPLEECRPAAETVVIRALSSPGAFIRKRGADGRKGRTVVRAGHPVHPEHLPLLAETGTNEITGCRRPRVAILCTGSELLELPASPAVGQIISGNHYLLAALVREAGGIPLALGIAPDQKEKIELVLRQAIAGAADMIITSGGMGPGKYDLMAAALEGLGVEIFFRRLALRPGRATLFGILQGKPVFALPGPPPAVFPIFHELVRPALRKMQGAALLSPPPLRAVLTEELLLNDSGGLQLKAGVVRPCGEILTVRPAKKYEPAGAIMVIPSHRRRLRAGEKITVHPLA